MKFSTIAILGALAYLASGVAAAAAATPTLIAEPKATAAGGNAAEDRAFTTPKTLRIGVYPDDAFFTTWSTGFEASLLDDICEQLKVDCNVTILDTLDQRITNLQNNISDLTLGHFSVTPERAANVSFVKPYYYSAGATIFTTEENLQTINSKGWNALNGKNVCLVTDYYAATPLATKYGFTPVFTADTTVSKSKVESGDCYATIADDIQTLDVMLPMTDVKPELQSAYAFAVAKGNDVLAALVSAAMFNTMDDGAESLVLKYEKEFLAPIGIQANSDLNNTVTAISNFVGVGGGSDVNCNTSTNPTSSTPARNMAAGVVGVAILALFA